MICDICLDVLHRREQPFSETEEALVFIHHKTASSLRASASENCHLCQPIWNQLSHLEQEAFLALDLPVDELVGDIRKKWLANKRELETGLTTCALMEGASLLRNSNPYVSDTYVVSISTNKHVDLSHVSKKENFAMGLFLLQPSADIDRNLLGQPAADSTASDESWSLAVGWIGQCTAGHARCNATQTQSCWYPTRLLEIVPSDAEPKMVRLIVCESQSISSPYVTLSHCWGSAQILQLTRSSLQRLKGGIAVESLPQTFQDSIKIARRMKICYIWVDSLCIMQDKDDISDWMREAALMHKVYSHSYCNISATAAVDSSRGLFVNRDPKMIGSVEIDLGLKGLKHIQERTTYTLIDFQFWQYGLGRAHLNQRGWVVQERLLAPRVLHFGPTQLFWECCEMDAAETYPRGLPHILGTSAASRFKSLEPLVDGARLRQRGPGDSDSRFYAHQLWPRIVQAYSSALLSYPGDKLVALSGIAKKMIDVIQDDYVAGMWSRYLASQLLWHVDGCRQINNEPSRRPQEYRAPSFSWASVDGVISTSTITDKGILIEADEVKLEHVTEDSTGLVKAGSLRLRGTLKRLNFARQPVAHMFWVMVVNGINVVEVRAREGEEYTSLGHVIHFDVAPGNLDENKDARSLYCMPARAPCEGWRFLECLILESVDESLAAFRRIGVAVASDAEVIQIIQEHSDNEVELPCEHYSEEDRKHTIRLL